MSPAPRGTCSSNRGLAVAMHASDSRTEKDFIVEQKQVLVEVEARKPAS